LQIDVYGLSHTKYIVRKLISKAKEDSAIIMPETTLIHPNADSLEFPVAPLGTSPHLSIIDRRHLANGFTIIPLSK
jgi:hypothetical protein